MEMVEVGWTAVLGVAAVAPLATFGVVLVQLMAAADARTARQQRA